MPCAISIEIFILTTQAFIEVSEEDFIRLRMATEEDFRQRNGQ